MRDRDAETWCEQGFWASAWHWHHTLEMLNAWPLPPCPSWCVLPDGHPLTQATYADDDHGRTVVAGERQHRSADMGNGEVIASFETVYRGRVLVLESLAPHYVLDGEACSDPLALRRAAAAMLNAADLLDEVSR